LSIVFKPTLKVGLNYAVVIFALTLLTGCDETPSSEELFRQTLKQMEHALEQRNVDDFMDHISGSYSDRQSRNRDDIRRIAQLHVLRNKNLHLFQHVTHMDFVEDESARVVVLVALAGRPIDSIESLSTIKAELMEFRVSFIFDQKWTAVSADWSRTGLNGFL
jgi:hypothetical protein